jgi:hypothetical protein
MCRAHEERAPDVEGCRQAVLHLRAPHELLLRRQICGDGAHPSDGAVAFARPRRRRTVDDSRGDQLRRYATSSSRPTRGARCNSPSRSYWNRSAT